MMTSRFPYPINKGDKLRSYHQIKELSKQNDIYLISLSETKIPKSSIDELYKYCKSSKRINIISFGFITRCSKLRNGK